MAMYFNSVRRDGCHAFGASIMSLVRDASFRGDCVNPVVILLKKDEVLYFQFTGLVKHNVDAMVDDYMLAQEYELLRKKRKKETYGGY